MSFNINKQIIDWNGLCEMIRRCAYEKKPEPNDAKNISVALKAFWHEPEIISRQIQAFTVSTDIPEDTGRMFSKFLALQVYDEGWKKAFREVPIADGHDGWDIYDVTSGVTIRQIREGERLRVEGMSGSIATVRIGKYGGAWGWSDELFRYRKLAAIQDMAVQARNSYWKTKADNHYTLIAAAAPGGGANSTAWQGAVTDTQIDRDLATINEGAYTIGNRVKDKNYDQNQFILYLPESMRTRGAKMQKAVSAGVVILSDSQKSGAFTPSMTYPVDFNYTWSSLVPANTGFLVLPGNKIQRNDTVQPFVLSDSDILTLMYYNALWSYYGAAIGDTDQVQRLAFA